jgi:geranylgeranyl diphosphate synthase type II
MFNRDAASLIAAVEADLQAAGAVFESTESDTGKAMAYALKSGGKRIRPLLLLLFARSYGGDPAVMKRAVSVASALEFIHTFSLVHDDLPFMDDDMYRRGKPCTHKVFGEAAGMLAGDALSLYAFTHIARAFEAEPGASGDVGSRSACGLRLIRELSAAAGLFGMCGGQDLDLRFMRIMDGRPDINDLLDMYAMKTGELIRFACRAGCIVAQADEDEIENAGNYAMDLGLAFQLTDDILDAGEDKSVGKVTYVTICGEQAAKDKAAELTRSALACLERVPNNRGLITLTDQLLNRTK